MEHHHQQGIRYTIAKPSIDDLEYRSIVLENGLK